MAWIITFAGVFAMGCVVAHHVPTPSDSGLLGVGVPWFFFASGFWMGFRFLDGDGVGAWKRECARRVRTLLLPYFIWNLMWFPILFAANWVGWRYCGAERVVDGSVDSIVRCLGLSVWQWPALVPTWFLRSLFVASVLVGGVWTLLGLVKSDSGRRLVKAVRMIAAAIAFWGIWWIVERHGPSGGWWDGFFCFGIPAFGMACFATGGAVAAVVGKRPESGGGFVSIIRRQMMPVFLLHVPVILMISWVARAVGQYHHLMDVRGSVVIGVAGVVGAIVAGEMMRAFMPRVTGVLFGGR